MTPSIAPSIRELPSFSVNGPPEGLAAASFTSPSLAPPSSSSSYLTVLSSSSVGSVASSFSSSSSFLSVPAPNAPSSSSSSPRPSESLLFRSQRFVPSNSSSSPRSRWGLISQRLRPGASSVNMSALLNSARYHCGGSSPWISASAPPSAMPSPHHHHSRWSFFWNRLSIWLSEKLVPDMGENIADALQDMIISRDRILARREGLCAIVCVGKRRQDDGPEDEHECACGQRNSLPRPLVIAQLRFLLLLLVFVEMLMIMTLHRLSMTITIIPSLPCRSPCSSPLCFASLLLVLVVVVLLLYQAILLDRSVSYMASASMFSFPLLLLLVVVVLVDDDDDCTDDADDVLQVSCWTRRISMLIQLSALLLVLIDPFPPLPLCSLPTHLLSLPPRLLKRLLLPPLMKISMHILHSVKEPPTENKGKAEERIITIF